MCIREGRKEGRMEFFNSKRYFSSKFGFQNDDLNISLNPEIGVVLRFESENEIVAFPPNLYYRHITFYCSHLAPHLTPVPPKQPMQILYLNSTALWHSEKDILYRQTA